MQIYFPENEIPEKARLNRFLRFPIITEALIKTLFGKNVFDINNEINKYDFDTNIDNKFSKLKLKLKMVYYRYAYEFLFCEFSGYGFEHKSKKECLEYVSSYEYLRLHNEIEQSSKVEDIFSDKRKTYELFSNYFKRDVSIINGPKDLQEYLQFVQKHKRFIVKQPKQNNGRGISVVDLNDKNINVIDFFKKCLSSGGAIIEELVVQPGIIHDLYPHSVNTVRFITYFSNNELTKIGAVLRIGMNGSIVDNASQGGLYACIDINTGKLKTDGCIRFQQKKYITHPDTNVTIKNIQLPEWDSLLQLIDDLVRVYPQKNYVGWDLAYSDKGWVLIEGNGYPGIYLAQKGAGKGLRKTFSQTLFLHSNNSKKYSKAIL